MLVALAGFRSLPMPGRTRRFPRPQRGGKRHQGLLIAAASIAILTTLGIVLSMLFETRNFFQQYSWVSFFFGLEWAPDFRGNSSLSILPLLWGTLYISFIALLVAVPIGLFAAIYLSEYAKPPGARGRQAAARGAGRHPDHRLRPVRADHRGPDAARLLRRAAWARLDSSSSGDDRRAGDGDHADPVRVVAVR